MADELVWILSESYPGRSSYYCFGICLENSHEKGQSLQLLLRTEFKRTEQETGTLPLSKPALFSEISPLSLFILTFHYFLFFILFD
jgi:hypothetical protein